MVRQVWSGVPGPSRDWLSKARQVGCGKISHSEAWNGVAGQVGNGWEWCGRVRLGVARLGRRGGALTGVVRQGMARHGSAGMESKIIAYGYGQRSTKRDGWEVCRWVVHLACNELFRKGRTPAPSLESVYFDGFNMDGVTCAQCRQPIKRKEL